MTYRLSMQGLKLHRLPEALYFHYIFFNLLRYNSSKGTTTFQVEKIIEVNSTDRLNKLAICVYVAHITKLAMN